MRAAVARRYGSPEVLTVEDVPVPRPGPGQILVRIRAAAVNPGDLHILSGELGGLARLTFPHVPGSDFAGTVIEAGADVSRFAEGDEVFGTALPRAATEMAAMLSAPPSLSTGAMADCAVFEAASPAIARGAHGLAAAHAASLPIPGLTALAVIRAGRFEPDERVLVIGAAGGVGGALVPLLASEKAYVIAAALTEDEAYVRDLGAADVIDYHTADITAETLRRYPGGADAMVNLALPGPALPDASRAIRPQGRLINVAFPSPDPALFKDASLTVRTVYANASSGDLDHLAAQAANGTLPPTISRHYPLRDAARAYTDLAHAHVHGKLIVTPDRGLITAR